MDFQQFINGIDIWAVSAVMVCISVLQSVFFFRHAWKEADNIGISVTRRKTAIRSAALTAMGPALSPIVIMISMIAIAGAPTTWMVLNNVGAARTELAVISIAANYTGVEMADLGVKGFTYALWAIALNGFGWLFVVFFLNHKMSSIVNGLNTRYDPKWISKLLAGANLGLFAYLLTNQLVGKAGVKYIAALISGATMIILSKVCKKVPFLEEVSLGVSMLTGMFLSQLFA